MSLSFDLFCYLENPETFIPEEVDGSVWLHQDNYRLSSIMVQITFFEGVLVHLQHFFAQLLLFLSSKLVVQAVKMSKMFRLKLSNEKLQRLFMFGKNIKIVPKGVKG